MKDGGRCFEMRKKLFCSGVGDRRKTLRLLVWLASCVSEDC